jgi:UDP-N-acetylglucosamine 2-epimerase (non-hydrolysing)/GDP/UDP-N,N'-diacetylbacillosamine 2-epimerase (hydrolysing)
MRVVGVVTSSRADYGIYLPVLRRIRDERELALRLLVTGMHLSPRFGMTVGSIEADGFEAAERVESLSDSDDPAAVAESMARGTAGFARVFARSRPDILVVLGDRFEMHAAALAALPFKIPVAHIHGGESTEGAIDDALRHSMTKLSHLHFTATREYGDRLVRMGEEPWRVTVSGAPSLDNLASVKKLAPAELEARFGLRVTPDTLLVTFHPATLESGDAGCQADELLAALAASGRPVVFTMPNADTGGLAIRERIERFVQSEPAAQAVENLGTEGYFSLLALCAAMVGNSSSGLLEAPSFGLPAVNVGTRQQGRVRGANVIDVGCTRDGIARGLAKALDPAFRESLRGKENPYGDGRAAERIVARLGEVHLDRRLLMKRFYDSPPESGGPAACAPARPNR